MPGLTAAARFSSNASARDEPTLWSHRRHGVWCESGDADGAGHGCSCASPHGAREHGDAGTDAERWLRDWHRHELRRRSNAYGRRRRVHQLGGRAVQQCGHVRRHLQQLPEPRQRRRRDLVLHQHQLRLGLLQPSARLLDNARTNTVSYSSNSRTNTVSYSSNSRTNTGADAEHWLRGWRRVQPEPWPHLHRQRGAHGRWRRVRQLGGREYGRAKRLLYYVHVQ